MGTGGGQVLVIGAAGFDLKVFPREPAVEPARSNPGTIRWAWGGVARNIAENLARLGVDVRLVTAVGDDWWGHALLQDIKSIGVDTSGCVVSEMSATASYVALHHTDRRLWVAFDDMAVIREITPAHLYRLRRSVREADLVCIDANLSAPALRTLFRLCEQYETPVCVDPTAALLAHRLHAYLPRIAIITPDRDEAEALLGIRMDNEDAISMGARRFVQLGVQLAIITLGADGLYYATSEESGRLPALPVEVVDPTGAGDALTAAVAYGLLEGVSPEEAVRLGMAAAAHTIECQDTVCPDLSPEALYERLVL